MDRPVVGVRAKFPPPWPRQGFQYTPGASIRFNASGQLGQQLVDSALVCLAQRELDRSARALGKEGSETELVGQHCILKVDRRLLSAGNAIDEVADEPTEGMMTNLSGPGSARRCKPSASGWPWRLTRLFRTVPRSPGMSMLNW